MNRPFKHKKEQLPHLSITRLEQLRTLFAQKKWPVDEDIELSVFERFYKTLSMLNDKEQDFLLNLSYKFEHIPQSEYLKHMLAPLSRLRRDEGKRTLLFVTCTPKEDVGNVKSSAMVLYQLKGTTLRHHMDISPKSVIENILRLTDYSVAENTTIVLVDDFVGTGETAVNAVDFVRELQPSLKDNSKIVVLCIVALHEGINKLAEIGVKTYCSIERGKGISEETIEKERDRAKEMMDGIESHLIKLKEEFKFGYNGSEALVCMERCPNNTFPIYWLTKNIAPYER